MTTERLIVKNFGPIKDIDIEVKDVNVLIGTTGSGKSTVAKLLAIFRSTEFLYSFDRQHVFKELMRSFVLENRVEDGTEIRYSRGSINFTITEDFQVQTNVELFDLLLYIRLSRASQKLSEVDVAEEFPFHRLVKMDDFGLYFFLNGWIATGKHRRKSPNDNLLWENLDKYDALETPEQEKFQAKLESMYGVLGVMQSNVYIPAERILISMVGNSIFGLLKNDVTIAQCVINFGADFEKARNELSHIDIAFLGIQYSFVDNQNIIYLADGTDLKLEHASSGVQSIVPLMLILEERRKKGKKGGRSFLVIEEPEINLYPIAQKNLAEHITAMANESDSKLFITTHSPYILTALDNLVQAHNAFRAHPEKEAEIEKIIPKSQWLDFDNVSCYFFDKGTCKSTLNHELRTLGSSAIDDVSIEIGKEFDLLTDIQYA